MHDGPSAELLRSECGRMRDRFNELLRSDSYPKAKPVTERVADYFNHLLRAASDANPTSEESQVPTRMTDEQEVQQLVEELLKLGDFTESSRPEVELVDGELGSVLSAVYEAWPTHAPLIRVLVAALAQSATGKGLERHGTLAPAFHDQPIHLIADLLGDGGHAGHLFQAMKKISEAKAMLDNGVNDAQNRAIRELLGAIVYISAAADRIGGGR